MGYKMKGAPMYDTSSKHGTNKNYQMSGMTKDGAPFLGGIGKAIGRGLKGAAKFGAFGPLGNIASALIDKNKAKQGGNEQAPPPQPAAQMNTQMAAAAPAPAPAPAGAVDPSAPPVDPNMVDPNATNA